ncbi:hypothetical protein [Aeromonas enteropelogenes]|uniref:hypothetical protein n=1 Tax=Aeromonas enteropelogenes TaxID=29489 RepID=UPI003BA0E16A
MTQAINNDRPLLILPSGNMYRVCQGGKTLAFAETFAWAVTRREMIRNGVLDVPALMPTNGSRVVWRPQH